MSNRDTPKVEVKNLSLNGEAEHATRKQSRQRTNPIDATHKNCACGQTNVFQNHDIAKENYHLTSCTMDGFCHLYLLMILLMRSGDVETNPGPDRIVSEEEFLKLSKLIRSELYEEVGINLKISITELDQIEEDSRNTRGALLKLFTRWRDRQPPGTNIRALLAEGLAKSDLKSISGELLAGSLVPNITATKGETSAGAGATFLPVHASSQATGMSTLTESNKREVTDKEITKLSKLLPDGKYNELCEILGFDYSYVQNIKKRNSMDPMAAFKEIMQEWKIKEKFREDLDAALRKAELGGLVSKYKN